jgi:alkylation response protein AidB-like acyl-CoA dehydrogenase
MEALLYHARTSYLAGTHCEAELSVLKWRGVDWALEGAEHVLRLTGARGYESARGPEKDVRDLMGLSLLGGTCELHKGVVFTATTRGT